MQNAKKKKRGDKISVTLEWALLSATDDVSCTFMPVSDEASAPTLLHLRNDFRKSPRRPVEDDVYVKKANTGGEDESTFSNQEIFIISSPNSAVIDEQSCLSNFSARCIFNFTLLALSSFTPADFFKWAYLQLRSPSVNIIITIIRPVEEPNLSFTWRLTVALSALARLCTCQNCSALVAFVSLRRKSTAWMSSQHEHRKPCLQNKQIWWCSRAEATGRSVPVCSSLCYLCFYQLHSHKTVLRGDKDFF